MSLRVNALFEGPVVGARLRTTNPDASTPLVLRQVSKVPTFNFSGAATLAAVTITVKTDNGTVVSDSIDLSSAADDEAVTAAELAAAITTAAVTNLTASVESSTGRVKLALSTPGSAKYFAVGGEVGELAGFGYGYGTGFSVIDTASAIALAPTQKDSESLTLAGSDGKEVTIITNAYVKGGNVTLNDTAWDADLLAKLEGGTWRDDGYDNLAYVAPGTSTKRPTVDLEWFSTLYADGDNQEDNVQGYLWYRARSGKLTTVGEKAGDRNVQARVFTIALTPYKAVAASKALTPADADENYIVVQKLTIEEFEALDWKNV